MKKKLFVFAVCILSLQELFSQAVVGGVSSKGLDMQASPGGFVTQLPMAPAETKGDVYLNSEWIIADIALFNQTSELKDYSIKINLQTNDIEINYQNQVRVLSGRNVKHFTLKKNDGAFEKYVNGKSYTLNNTPIVGFFKVIDSGKWELLIKPQVKLVKSSYVAALDAGDRSDYLVKEEVYFFSKNKSLYETRMPVKRFSKQFSENEIPLSNFIKEHDLGLKRIDDLKELLHFMNTSM